MFDSARDPVADVLSLAHVELDDLDDIPLFGLTDHELEARQVAAERLIHRISELALRLAAASSARGLDTKTTLVRAAGYAPKRAHQRVRLATALAGHEPVRAAMAAGVISESQAAEILEAVDNLPDHLDCRVAPRAEQHLVTLAADHDAAALRTLGTRVLAVVAPDVADRVLAAQLQREHDHAEQTCRLTLTDDGHGRTHLRGHVPSHVGAMLKRNLLALQAPKHVRGSGQECALTRRPGPERLGRAFCEYVERYRTHALPHAGGVQARAVVTIDHHQLVDAVDASGVATIDGTPIPAGTARRLACEAGILPAVLDGAGKPLDLGRTRRFHDTTQRLALELRDRTCTADGCDWPAYLCHAHHDVRWTDGGKTSVDAGRLLCPRHHQLAHHPKWELTRTKHGRVTFLRR